MEKKEQNSFVVDVSGGESGTCEVLKGCVKALKDFGDLHLILVGDEEKILSSSNNLMKKYFDRIAIEHTSKVIGMGENPAKQCKRNPDSSIMVAARETLRDDVFGFFSPGNTGATLTAAMLTLQRIDKVKRAMLVTLMPTERGHVVLLDSGAFVDINPKSYFMMGLLGKSFAEAVLGKSSPSVGLLSIGSEPNKGSKVSKAVYKYLEGKLPGFYGNIEANYLFTGIVDVVLADGFVGNIVIKLMEGFGKSMPEMMKSRLKVLPFHKRLREGAGVSKSENSFSRGINRLTNSEFYGAAPLMGFEKIVMVGHGKAKGFAVYNAIRNALHYRDVGLIEKTKVTLKKHRKLLHWSADS